MKVTERRIVTQYWRISESPKLYYESYGWMWYGEPICVNPDEGWEIVKIIKSDKIGNPVLAIAERETEI